MPLKGADRASESLRPLIAAPRHNEQEWSCVWTKNRCLDDGVSTASAFVVDHQIAVHTIHDRARDIDEFAARGAIARALPMQHVARAGSIVSTDSILPGLESFDDGLCSRRINLRDRQNDNANCYEAKGANDHVTSP